jgi:hypothetical protein
MSSPFAIIHIEPLHKCAEFEKEGGHNFREYQPKNADPARGGLNQILYGPASDLAAVARERYRDVDKELRKDARRGASMILSLTRDAFLGLDDQISGERVEDFKALAMAFLRGRYESALVSAVLHCDERTPHIHAVLIPQQPNGKPAYKQNFGTGRQLSEMQSDYARAMEPLGVKRGVFNSKASHEEIDRFYKRLADVEASVPAPEQLATPAGREQAMTVIVQAQAAAKAAREECDAFKKERDDLQAAIATKDKEQERLRAENARLLDGWRNGYKAAEYWKQTAAELGDIVCDIKDQADLDRALDYVEANISPPEETEAAETGPEGPK